MYRFPSAHAAFAWSAEILDVWRNGKGFDPDPDYIGGGGTGVLSAVLVALQVERMAQDACRMGTVRCPTLDRGCFMNWFMPDPTKEPPKWTRFEVQRITSCVAAFEGMLRDVGWLE